MALKGTLSDLGLVALIQFPNSGRRTGLLTVVSGSRQAELFYVNGNLVHAAMGQLEGQKVLVEMVDWTEGSFTFDSGITTGSVTIEQDLHRTIMLALKERDEMKKAQAEARIAATAGLDIGRWDRLLSEFVDSSPGNLWACIMDGSGRALAGTPVPEEHAGAAPGLVKSLADLISGYPGGPPARLIVEDQVRTSGIMTMDSGLFLMVVVRPDIRMGMLCMALSRLLESVRRRE